MKRAYIAALLSLLIAGCGTYGDTAPVDSTTGKPALPSSTAKAEVLVAQKIPLDRYKGLLVVMPHAYYTKADEVQQIQRLGYFDTVVGSADLPKLVVEQGLQDQVMSFSKWSGYQQLFRAYKPYLVIRFSCLEKDGVRYRLLVTRPDTLEDVFVSEVVVWSEAGHGLRSFLTLGAGIYESNLCSGSDQEVRYPLLNSLADWINENR